MRRLHTWLSALVLGALVTCLGAGEAHAQSDATRQRARQLYATGQALFDSGQFAQAEASFRAAYEAVPNPVVLRAIAAAQERQGNVAQAAQTLQQYLRDSPNASDRAEVERHLTELTGRPATLAITSTPPGAQILLDGQPTGQTTPAEISMEAGDHAVELRLDGYQPFQQTVTAQASARLRMEVPLTAGAADALGANGGDGQAAAGGGGGGSDAPTVEVWVTAGIAAAALISGTVFGFLALSEQSNFDMAPSNEIADRGELFALIADISFGAAILAAGTAIVLYIVERSSGGSGAQTSMIEQDGLALDVAPWAARNSGGVAAQLRF